MVCLFPEAIIQFTSSKEWINKQFLVDIDWLNKVVLKLPLTEAIKLVFCVRYNIKKCEQVYENQSMTLKIFLIFKFSRKRKILHFFSNTCFSQPFLVFM